MSFSYGYKNGKEATQSDAEKENFMLFLRNEVKKYSSKKEFCETFDLPYHTVNRWLNNDAVPSLIFCKAIRTIIETVGGK